MLAKSKLIPSANQPQINQGQTSSQCVGDYFDLKKSGTFEAANIVTRCISSVIGSAPMAEADGLDCCMATDE
jgi:hypothetical protein